MAFADTFLAETRQIAERLNTGAIERLVAALAAVRERGGRLFILGVGGSAGNAGHAVNDFRKLAGFEAYAPTDNVSELTARANDEGWDTIFSAWLRVSRLTAADALLIFSVGGGDAERNVSPNLVRAVAYAKEIGSTVLGIVGRNGGYTAMHAMSSCRAERQRCARHAAFGSVPGRSSGTANRLPSRAEGRSDEWVSVSADQPASAPSRLSRSRRR